MAGYRGVNVVGRLSSGRIRCQVVYLEIQEHVTRLVTAVIGHLRPFLEYPKGIGQDQQAVFRETVALFSPLDERRELQIAYRKFRYVEGPGDKRFGGFAIASGVQVGHEHLRAVRTRGNAGGDLFQYHPFLAPAGNDDGPVRLVLPFLDGLKYHILLVVGDGQIDREGGDVDPVLFFFEGKLAGTAQEIELQVGLFLLPPETAHVHGEIDLSGTIGRQL